MRSIVLTGGPCGGKSTAMQALYRHYSDKGYTVVLIPETATQLLGLGISPESMGSVLAFQTELVHRQLQKERDVLASADDNTIVICDRGALDSKAYLSDVDYTKWLQAVGHSEIALRDRYDAVFYLQSTASGKSECYSTADNIVRRESCDQAAAADTRSLCAWIGHPHLRMVPCCDTMEQKIDRLIEEVDAFLADVEIERKYLVSYPDLQQLDAMETCVASMIEQVYLCGGSRIRMRGDGIDAAYYLTYKQRIDDVHRIERESKISQAQYLEYKKQPNLGIIRKTRYCIAYEHQYFELDLFPFWQDKALLELELTDESRPICFPPFLNILGEVTHDKAYTNRKLAERYGKNKS